MPVSLIAEPGSGKAGGRQLRRDGGFSEHCSRLDGRAGSTSSGHDD
ncbi:hypothetical protein [Streptomyces cyaneofuscatus]